MSGAGDPRNTWRSLLVDLARGLSSCGPTSVFNETDYRKAYQQICSKHKEPDPKRLLARLRKQHDAIIVLAKAVDAAQKLKKDLSEPETLTSLVWCTLHRAVEAAFASKQDLAQFISETELLNDLVDELPRIDLDRFPNHVKVQKPLQELYRQYMASYMTILSGDVNNVLDLACFREKVDGQKIFFEQQRSDWESAFKEAQAEEHARRQFGRVSAHAPIVEPLDSQSSINTEFKRLGPLGRGAFGQVSEVEEVSSKGRYARKFIQAPRPGGGDEHARSKIEDRVRNEVQIMQKLRHHHIATMQFYISEPTGFSLIMLPVADYDLRVFLEDHCIAASYPRAQISSMDPWFGCLANALTYAHDQAIKHEDIKPSNVLIQNGQPFLADFGSARDFSSSGLSTSHDQQVTGTPVYWPPEEHGHRGRPADVFSLGCVFAEMLTVRQKRSLVDFQEYRRVNEREYPYAFRKNLDKVIEWLKDLPGLKEENGIKVHEVPALVLDSVLNMLKKEPEDRIEARNVKKNFRKEYEQMMCPSC